MQGEKSVVLLDGAYLSIINKHLGNGTPIKIDIKQFGITLARSLKLWCETVYYFTAPPFQGSPPISEQIERRRGYDRYIVKLKKIPDLIVREGRCQKIGGEYKQKAVDTWITMDLLETYRRKDVKKILLLACDTDFVPIIKQGCNMGKDIIIFYYSDFKRNSQFSMSNHILTASTNAPILIDKTYFDKSMLRHT